MAFADYVSFNLSIDNINGVYLTTDITDYTAAGYGSIDFEIRLKLTILTSAGTQTIYDNTSGVVPNGNSISNPILDFEFPASVLVDGQGNIIKGTYSLTAQITDPDGNVATLQKSFDYVNNLSLPEVSCNITVSCATATITGQDTTNYSPQAIAINREFSLIPPGGAYFAPNTPATPSVTSQAINVYGSPIFDKTWTWRIYSIVIFQVEENFQIRDDISGSAEFVVTCDTDLCEVLCCIVSVYNNYINEKTRNPAKAKLLYENTIVPMIDNFVLFLGSQSCGNATQSAELRDKIIAYSNCKDCGCNSEDPKIIIATQQAGLISIVEAADTSVTVTPTTVGSTTTYRVQVSTSLQTIINNLKNTEVAAGTGVTVVASVGAQGQTIYTVSVSPSGGSATTVNWLEVKGAIEANVDVFPNTYSFTPTYLVKQGTKISETTDIVWQLGSNYPTSPVGTDKIVLRGKVLLKNDDDFNLRANVMSNYPAASSTDIATEFANMKNMEAECMWMPNSLGSEAVIRIYSPIDGHILQFNELSGVQNKILVGIQVIGNTIT